MFYFILRSGLTCIIYDTYEVPDVYFFSSKISTQDLRKKVQVTGQRSDIIKTREDKCVTFKRC